MSSPAKPDLNDVLPRLNDMMREDDHWGDVAAYIPQLATVDP
ncbi:MAG TPA: glutaminase, partial [Sulfitobacter sp.]|nr:glutaminase [Sulfitobacter sp.]